MYANTDTAIRKPLAQNAATHRGASPIRASVSDATIRLVLGRKHWVGWELDLGKGPRPTQRCFSETETARIIAAAQGQFRLICCVLAATGMRLGECLALHVDDVDLDQAVICVRRTVWA